MGQPTPRHLLEHLNSRDIGEWIAYYSIEPFGSMHNEHMTGIIASQIYNAHRGKDQPAADETDFMPHYQASETSSDELKDNYYAWLGATHADR